ncbi:DUF1499 domain-containing protein [Rhodospirillum sp. A1_3_36]|uniref:DUF1499 domain-containing protein n=1 Tax=Rhodospirillum sp. A1_3_36 TaxID=3391666 RepID=UPI0039A4AFA3
MSVSITLLGLGALLLGGAFGWAVVTGNPLPTAALMPAPLAPVANLAAPPFPKTPNWALALPPDAPSPDPEAARSGVILTAPRYPLSAKALFQRASAVIGQLPNVTITHQDPKTGRIDGVAISRWLGFPDTISLQVIPLDSTTTSLILFSQSRVGYWDLGVNARRIRTWLCLFEVSPSDGRPLGVS